MKHTTKIILCIALVLIVITPACNDESREVIDSKNQILQVPSRVNVKKMNPDIIIAPSGDISGIIDADAIDNALGSVPAGGTVLLESGTYYINRQITVVGFEGTLSGMGKEETNIIGVGGNASPFSGFTLFQFPDPSDTMMISHLSLSLPLGFEAISGNLFSFMLTQIVNDDANTHFDNLKLNGTDAIPGSAPFLIDQPESGIVVEGDASVFPTFTRGGTHRVTNSSFSKISIQATRHQFFKNATIEISDNSYTEIKQTIYRYLDGCTVKITNNQMDTYSFGAIVVTQEGAPIIGDPNSVLIRGNRIKTAGFMPIEIGGVPDGAANFKLLIEKNNLTNSGADPVGFFTNFTGIGIFYGNDGAVVRNNRIYGTPEFGILQESSNGAFIGNNLQGVNTFAADYGLFGNDNTVVGKGKSTVIDGGAGNIITGMTKVEGVSIGDRIKEAQAKRKEIIDALHDN